MENKSHAFLAGMFTLLLGLAVVLAITWLGGKREETREYLVVTRQNVSGLNPQAQVRYRGIRVGKVSDIRLDPNDLANILITIEINASLPVTRGTTAKLGYQGVTGLAHVLLQDSEDDTNPLLAEKGPLPRIDMAPSLMDELGEEGPALLRDAREALKAVALLANADNRQRLGGMLARLEESSARVTPTLQKMEDALDRFNRLLSDDNLQRLKVAAGESGPLLTETRQLAVRLQKLSGALEGTLAAPAAGGQALSRMNTLASELALASRQLGRLLQQLDDTPHSLVFGTPPTPPGPGEAGFVTPPPVLE